jgi:hypothetical protein
MNTDGLMTNDNEKEWFFIYIGAWNHKITYAI